MEEKKIKNIQKSKKQKTYKLKKEKSGPGWCSSLD